jgi:hypothetical protein
MARCHILKSPIMFESTRIGTTAEAIISANKEDNGDRKCIIY